jgi:hypothetical protein
MDLTITTENFVKTMTESLIASMTTEIRQQIVHDVSSHIMNFDLQREIKDQIDAAVSRAIQGYATIGNDGKLEPFQNNAVASSVFNEFARNTDNFLETLRSRVQQRIVDELSYKLNTIDMNGMIREFANLAVKEILFNYNFSFPDNSIPGRCINPEGIKIHAENILPGTIKKFESTGIQDYATQLQLTILDDATIIENRLVAKSLDITEDLNIRGKINTEFTDNMATEILAKVNQQYTDGTFDQYCDRVMVRLAELGIPASQIKTNGQNLVVGETLAPSILESNLQKVGALKKLIVIGETLLDETVYVSTNRIGINTKQPERVLDLWDQEVQIVAGKRMKDVALIGTLRSQKVVLSSGNKDNLVLNPDGSIVVNNLVLGKVNHTSAAERPVDNRAAGQVVWNENPNIGSPIGWVSLGGARWAGFGIVVDN